MYLGGGDMEKYNRLTVLKTWVIKKECSTGKMEYRRLCECLCDCGNLMTANYYKVKTGHTKSCGCLVTEMLVERNTTHQLSKHPLFATYHSMIGRCHNKEHLNYHNYGARGIEVCDEWRKDISKFIEWAEEVGFEGEKQLDRIDNDGNYEPSNCRFVTVAKNLRNRRNNVIIDGLVLKDWINKVAIENNLKPTNVHTRYYKLKKKGIEITVDTIVNYNNYANQLPLSRET